MNASNNRSNPQCDFCAAEHAGPNEPGSCVMFWQGIADRYREVTHVAARLFDDDAPLSYDERFSALMVDLNRAVTAALKGKQAPR